MGLLGAWGLRGGSEQHGSEGMARGTSLTGSEMFSGRKWNRNLMFGDSAWGQTTPQNPKSSK